MRIIGARVPARIDFVGGGADCPPYSTEYGGAVVNAGITRYIYVTLILGEPKNRIKIVSRDFNVSVTSRDISELQFNGKLDLLKAAVKRFGPKTRFTIITDTELPPQSGLGGSAAVTVGVIGVLTYARGFRYSPSKLAELAFEVERKDLGLSGGKQDQYGTALGGLNYLEFHDPEVKAESLLKISPATLLELEKNLLLIYTGTVHLSENIHDEIYKSYYEPHSTTKKAMHNLTKAAKQAREALMKGDLNQFANLLNVNWANHKLLHSSCTNQRLEKVIRTGLKYGAMGAKVCGAGGGGCIVFLCKDGMKRKVQMALEKLNCIPLDFKFDTSGIVVYEFKK